MPPSEPQRGPVRFPYVGFETATIGQKKPPLWAVGKQSEIRKAAGRSRLYQWTAVPVGPGGIKKSLFLVADIQLVGLVVGVFIGDADAQLGAVLHGVDAGHVEVGG